MSEKKKMKPYEELEFSDDFMFGKVMEDPVLCREVLECLQGRTIGELTELQTQKEFRYTSDGKPIRLDVYNEDSEGVIYDAEMQNLNKKSQESLELPKRSRFYQAAIDIDHLNKSGSYKELPESNVIFICTFDPFMRGMSQYSFCEKCEESPDLALRDGTYKLFFNCAYEGDDISKDLRYFYDYVINGEIKNDLTKQIDRAVTKGRKNEIWRSQYMKEWVIIQDAREEGRREGKEEAMRDQIADMLKRNKTVDEIAEFCGYPAELVRNIEQNLLAGRK